MLNACNKLVVAVEVLAVLPRMLLNTRLRVLQLREDVNRIG